MQTLDELIAAAPMFAGLAPEHLALIAGCAATSTSPPASACSARATRPSASSSSAHGAVSLEFTAPGRGPLVIETLHRGDVVGWSWLFEPYRWEFDARASLARASSSRGRARTAAASP